MKTSVEVDLRGTKIFIPKIRGMKICTEKIRGRKTLPSPEKMLRAGSAPDKCPAPYDASWKLFTTLVLTEKM